MTLEPKIVLRLQFLVRVVRKECRHLAVTDSRLFKGLFTLEQVAQLETDPDLAALGEKISSTLDNLDRAERLGLLKSADEWLTMRNLRNQMIHEYVEDPVLLANALQTAHSFVPELIAIADKMIAEIEQRSWVRSYAFARK
jgi:hypothetical protein